MYLFSKLADKLSLVKFEKGLLRDARFIKKNIVGSFDMTPISKTSYGQLK